MHAPSAGGDGPRRPSVPTNYKPKSNLIQPKNYRLPRGQGDDILSNNEVKDAHGISSSPDDSPTDETGQLSPSLVTGSRVCVAGVKLGTLRYYGKTLFADGYWCGVELDEPEGKNNGSVEGVSYFTCAVNHGIFAPREKVVPISLSPEELQSESCALPEQFSLLSKTTKVKNSGLPRVRKLTSPKVTVKRKAENAEQNSVGMPSSTMDCTYNCNSITFESQPKVLRKVTGIPLPKFAAAAKENFTPEADVYNKTLVPPSSFSSDVCYVADSKKSQFTTSRSHLGSSTDTTLSSKSVQEVLNRTFEIIESCNAEAVTNPSFGMSTESKMSREINLPCISENTTFIHDEPLDRPPYCQNMTKYDINDKVCDVTFCSSGNQFASDKHCEISSDSPNATYVTHIKAKEVICFPPKDTDELLISNLKRNRGTTEVAPFSPNLTFIQEAATEGTTVTKPNIPEIYSLPNSPEFKLSRADLELLSSTSDIRKLAEETSEAVLFGDCSFPDILPSGNYESEDLVYGYGRQGSFDLDDSLGILTPNQMKDFTIFTETSIVKTPSVEDVQELCDDTFDDSLQPHKLAQEVYNETSVKNKKIIEQTFANRTTSTPTMIPVCEFEKTGRGISQEHVPYAEENISFFPLTEFVDTPQSESTISEGNFKDLSSINTPDDQCAARQPVPLCGSHSESPLEVNSCDKIHVVKYTVEKGENLSGNVTFSCSLDGKDVSLSATQPKDGLKITPGSRECHFRHIIANKSAADIADKLLVGVMTESVKEIIATCSDPFNFNVKTETASHGCEFQSANDHSMTEYLMQQMGPNFCDQIAEKKDRPMSALTVSVTSIDTGYQGDAECDVHSATTSAINTPVEESKKTFGSDDKDNALYPAEGLCVLRHPKTDVGSDSDFCSDMGTSWTESELENEEKIRGRCARVIDGTLYFNDNEVQEKSVCVKGETLSNVISVHDNLGGLSVLENVSDELQENKTTEENINMSSGSDESGTLNGKDLDVLEEKLKDEETLKMGTSTSSLEQNAQGSDSVEMDATEQVVLEQLAATDEVFKDSEENLKHQDNLVNGIKPTTPLAEKRKPSPKTTQVISKSGSVRKKPNENVSTKTKPNSMKESSEMVKTNSRKTENEVSNVSPGKSDASSGKIGISPGRANSSEKLKSSPRKNDMETPKKVKTPKKNVMSKIKAMIEATSCKVANDEETNEELKRPTRTPKKSRWEAVMSKIAAGQAEEKAKGKAIREVRSKIATTWTANKSPPMKSEDTTEKSANRYSNGSTRSHRSTRRTSRATSESANPEEVADDTVSINSSNRSSHSDLSASQQSLSKIPSKSRLPRMPPAATATSHKSERPCSPSQMSDISTMSAASHLSAASHGSHASHVSGRVLTRSSLAASRTLPRSKDGMPMPSKAAPVSSKVRQNNARNLSLGSSRVAATGPKTSSLLANNTASAMKQCGASASSLNTTQTKTTVPPRPLKPPVPSRVVAPAKPLPTRSQPLKEQNRIRNLKAAPSALRTGNQQPDLLNTSATSNKVEVCKEISRLEALCETRTKESSSLKSNLDHCAIGFEALTMVVKYMVDELDAFSNPYLVRDVRILQVQLEKLKSDFEEALQTKENLERKISDVVQAHELEIENLKSKQIQELENVQTSLTEAHRKELAEARETFEVSNSSLKESYQSEIDKIFEHHKSRQMKIRLRHEEELGKLAELHLLQVEGIKREHASLVETLKTQSGVLEADLQKQISLLSAQCHELEQQKREFEDVILKDSDLKMQVAAGKVCELNKEVDSLKTVVELRNKEIHDLRSSNSKIQKLEEELHLSQEKVSLLTTRMEDLQAQVDIKNKHGRKLSTEHQVLKEWYERESKASKRLSMEKEELQWKLQQTIECSPVHAGNAPDFTLLNNYSELDTMFAPVRTCGGDYTVEQSQKSSRLQNLVASPIYSKLPASKLGSPVLSRSSNIRAKQRQRFSICDSDSSVDSSCLPGVRYRRAASMSWTVGLDHGDAPDDLVSRMSLSCDQVLQQENEQSTGPLNHGSGDHTPGEQLSETSDESLLQSTVTTSEHLSPTLDERLRLAVDERLKSAEGTELSSDVDKQSSAETNAVEQVNEVMEQSKNEELCIERDIQLHSKLQFHSEENVPCLESPVSESSEKSEVSTEMAMSSEKFSKLVKLERRQSSADARVPSLITVQQLDEKAGNSSKSYSTSSKRDRWDTSSSKRISLAKCSSPKSNNRQEKESSLRGGKETKLMGNVRIGERTTAAAEVTKEMLEHAEPESISIEASTNYELFEEEIDMVSSIINEIKAGGNSHSLSNDDLERVAVSTASDVDLNATFDIISNSGASYISVDRSPSTFEEVNRAVSVDDIEPDLLCSSADTIEFDCSAHTNIVSSPHHSSFGYGTANESMLARKEGDVLLDGLQNIFSCDWGSETEKVARKSDSSMVNSDSVSSPSKSSLIITFKPQKLSGSSCDSSPPPEPMEMLQVSESSTSHSEESSPLPSPTFRSRPEEVTENLSCSYTMSPRTSAGEAMVLVDLSTTLRQEPSRDTSGLLLRRTFHGQYLTDSLSSCNSSLRVSAEACGKDSSSEETSQQCNSKPATPESCSQAVAPTDSTNIDLSWSDDDEEDIPSESEV